MAAVETDVELNHGLAGTKVVNPRAHPGYVGSVLVSPRLPGLDDIQWFKN